ncbi:33 kDa chaperonin (Heat shock protein 33) (HSP33) [Marinobacterium lacunae]|uniref:33 kDa chaperonin n=1 Tax=Marinobacterium lacunae TaxID=1232683 RepID=A0A081FY79_9GAMM|nr:Hsp33 family molecular chaperone HslO [Marinobacterium lacunae]KEA63484.1 33 kDa chaperonin (Heat shock protein 33) (HSP33) [Marinobacterium lacunae]MBR9884564.1 Hsp33 family molecular chaperone HslO [Oceanospirillales bacterium]
MSNSDQIQRILFDEIDVRGVVARVEESYAEVLSRASYPPAIQRILGEMLAAVSLLSSNLKFEGRLILQAQGDGALRVLMAECRHHHELRAIARLDGEIDDAAAFNELLVNGRLAITIEPDVGQRYQGVVPLEGATLAACLEAYFRQSEQLGTSIRLSADGQRAAGMLLQVLPAAGTGEDDWQRISMLASTLSDAELLGLDNETMLFRLFHEEQCRLYEPETLEFKCDCTRARSAHALQMMTEEELLSLAEEHDGVVEVSCHFCNMLYSFDTADIKALFSNGGPLESPGQVH